MTNEVNTARLVRVTASVPEICMHNVKLGPGCFCPHCPTASFPAEPKCPCGTFYMRVEGGYVPVCGCAAKNAVSVEPTEERCVHGVWKGDRCYRCEPETQAARTPQQIVDGMTDEERQALLRALNRT